jgi:hypothetical protein
MANIRKSVSTIKLSNPMGSITLSGKIAKTIELITLVVTVIVAINYIAKAVK